MKVLSVNLDRTVLNNDTWGDSVWRNVEYGKYLDEYHLVVIAHRRFGLKPKQLASNVWAYPTNGRGQYLPTRVWDAYRTASKVCAERHIDIIHTHNPLDTGLAAYLLGRKYDIPVVQGVYGEYVGNPHWLTSDPRNRFLNPMAKWLLRRADLVKVMSEEVQEQLVRQGVPGERIWAKPLAADLEKFALASPEKVATIRRRYAPNGESIVLFVGRLSISIKNVPMLLSAMPQVLSQQPKAKLLLCGDGQDRAVLEGLAHDLGLDGRVLFLGVVAYDQLPDYYAACDLVALTSNHEGSPRVLLEAAMAARPVVATATSGARLFVQDGATGFLVPIRDSQALAERIVALLNDSALRETMGKRARDYIRERFGADTLIHDVIMMWERAIELHSSARKRHTQTSQLQA